MEGLYENRYVRDKKTIKLICRYLQFGRKIQIVLQAILCTVFLCALVSAILGYEYNQFALIAVPLYFMYKLIAYHSQVKHMLRRDQEMFGGEAFVETYVTDEGIHSFSSGETKLLVSYDHVRSVNQTKKMILVFTKAKLIYILPKDSFTKGTAEECLAFLREKISG